MPKTATHAVREVLRPHLGEEDWEQQLLYGKMLSPIAEIAALGHGHISLQDIRPFVADEQWQAMHKFAVVRNPLDRFVSICAFLNRDNPEFARYPIQWMKAALRRPRFRQRVLVRPQCAQLCDAEGSLAMDTLLRYERLDEEMNKLLQQLGLREARLPQKNTSEHACYQEYYQDQELLRLVSEFYRQDFALLGYSTTLE